jgi:succinoglycan biosynthesis transport protein ExoP
MDYFRVMRERKWIVLATLVIVVAAVATYSLLKTPTYRASAEILRQSAALDETLFGNTVFQFQDATRQLETGANLVRLSVVGRMVKEDLGSERTVQALRDMTAATAVGGTDLIRITAQSDDPVESAAVANSFANQFIRYRLESYRSILATADEQVVTELDQMTPEELTSEKGITLTQKHEELGILWSMQTGGFELVQEATVPPSPVSPKPVRNTGFGLAGGLVLGILLAFLVDYVDRRIKSEETMEKEFGLPVLASVPKLARPWGFGRDHRTQSLIGFAEADSPFIEAYRTLRSNLRFYQMEHRTQTLLITSGLAQEGKTITTVNLGLSLALSGARVIILETDLRRPMIDKYLNLHNEIGVSSVLAGTSTFSDSLQIVRVPDFVPDPRLSADAQAKGSTMRQALLCMTSGPLPPNPSELLTSPRMKELIETAAGHAEYVLIDTPPILLVSDALNLAEHTNGVIIAARMKYTTLDEARDVRTTLQRSGCHALGIVANGVGTKRGGYYRTHYKGYHSGDPS